MSTTISVKVEPSWKRRVGFKMNVTVLSIEKKFTCGENLHFFDATVKVGDDMFQASFTMWSGRESAPSVIGVHRKFEDGFVSTKKQRRDSKLVEGVEVALQAFVAANPLF